MNLGSLAIVDALIAQNIQQLASDGIVHNLEAAVVRQRLSCVFDVENTRTDGRSQDRELLVKAHLVLFVC